MKRSVDLESVKFRLLDPDLRIARRATDDLQDLTPGQVTALLQLLESGLRDGDGRERERLTSVLPALSYTQLAAVLELTTERLARDSEPKVRHAAIDTLTTVHRIHGSSGRTEYAVARSAKILPALAGALRDPSPEVRAAAVGALARSDPSASKLVVPLLSDLSATVRANAAQAAGQMDDWDAVAPLLRLLRDDDDDVRLNAVDALGRLGDESASDPLRAVLRTDRHWKIRAEAASALAQLRDARAIPDLIAALRDGRPETVAAAATALAELSGRTDLGTDFARWSSAKLEVPATIASTAVGRRVAHFYARKQYGAGIAYARANHPAIASDPMAMFLLGELGVEVADFAAAEEGYAGCVRAIESAAPPGKLPVHGRVMVNPLAPPRELAWACYDGLSATLVHEKRYAEAAPWLKKAVVSAAQAGERDGVARAEYNIACTHAQTGDLDAATSALGRAITIRPAYRALARADPDFAPLAATPRFRDLTTPR